MITKAAQRSRRPTDGTQSAGFSDAGVKSRESQADSDATAVVQRLTYADTLYFEEPEECIDEEERPPSDDSDDGAACASEDLRNSLNILTSQVEELLHRQDMLQGQLTS